MKTQRIIYWTTTILFAGFMIFSAIPDVIMAPEAVTFITHLGYPKYFIPFIGVAKLLGCFAILIPPFRKIKEWAYAGLFFDLIGAVYSNIMTDGYNSGLLFMIPIIAIGAVSYYYYPRFCSSNA
ncbi:MAG TPA: DoxX family protein [Phnomibacter sp.]|nr:DoxX family protein [Phnomibacter sp.]